MTKYLSVNEWQGKVWVHIRTYMQLDDVGKFIPTKKGIALTIDEWQCLKNQINEVDALIYKLERERNVTHDDTTPLIPRECQDKSSHLMMPVVHNFGM